MATVATPTQLYFADWKQVDFFSNSSFPPAQQLILSFQDVATLQHECSSGV